MPNKNNYIIISVESRKGGVGKTTIVLNLAKLLRERYHVLVLDVDVTGTSINAIQETSVWKNSVRLLHSTSGTPINLLKFFKEQYLTGSHNMFFSTQMGEGETILIYPDFINVIGSELYSEDGSMLYDPAIIFDEIHDFWLLDMIQRIAFSFESAFDDDNPCVIILDNSPGYVGLGKSIHNMLTDIGPQRGKFLSVSSLDIQDIDSCLKAVSNIHQLTQAKEKGADYYYGAEAADLSALEEGSVEKETFDRLAVDDKSIAYYAKPNREKADVSDYQAVVFNKVPINVKNGSLIYKYDNRGNTLLSDTLKKLLQGKLESYMIPYDESIHYQFFRKNLSFSKEVEEGKHEHLEKQLVSLRRRARKQFENLNTGQWRKIAYSFNTMNRDLERVSDSLNEIGLFELASHINTAWFPEGVFRKMFGYLQSLELISNNREFYFPFFIPQKLEFERVLKMDFLNSQSQLACSTKAVFVVLESFLKHNEKAMPIVASLVEDILGRYFSHSSNISGAADLARDLKMFASHLQNDSYKAEQLFQLSFIETLVRVIDFSDDIVFFCDAISLYLKVCEHGKTLTDANMSWVLDEKIIKKTMDYNTAQVTLEREIMHSDYMTIVRQAISPIINQWAL